MRDNKTLRLKVHHEDFDDVCNLKEYKGRKRCNKSGIDIEI